MSDPTFGDVQLPVTPTAASSAPVATPPPTSPGATRPPESGWRKSGAAVLIALVTAALTFFVTDYLNRPKLAVHVIRIEQPGIDTFQFNSLAVLGLAEFFTDQPAVDDLASKAGASMKDNPGALFSLRSAKVMLPVAVVTKAVGDAENTMNRISNARTEFQLAKTMNDMASARHALDTWNQDPIITGYIADTPQSNDPADIKKALDDSLAKLDSTAKTNKEAIDKLHEDLNKAQDLAKQKTFVVRVLVVNGGNSAAAVMGLGLLHGDNWNLLMKGGTEPVQTISSGVDGFAIAPHQALTMTFKTDAGSSGAFSDPAALETASQQFSSGGLSKCRFNLLTSDDKAVLSDPFPFGGGDKYVQRATEILRQNPK